MKRIICVLLSVCMLLCLAACQGDVEHPRESESTVSTESQDLTESTKINKERMRMKRGYCRSVLRGGMLYL